ASLFFSSHNRIPLLYKPLGLRAEAPPHGQVTPTLPEESWGQVYTFVLPVPKGAPLLHKPLGPRAEAPPHRQVASSLPEESWGQVYTFFFPPEGESWGRVYSFFFSRRGGLGDNVPFLLSRRGTPPFYISLWDTARRPPRTVKSPQLSLRRVGAKCILSFFGFPKGNPMVHGELASRRPGCILGGVAPQQRESLAVLLARLRSDSPCTIGPPFYISLWDSARSPPPTVKSPLLSLRRVGAKCTLSIFPVSGSGNLRDWGLFSPSSALLCIRRDTETLATL